MRRDETVTESEAEFTLGSREWTLVGWKAGAVVGLTMAPVLFIFAVGVGTILGWLA